MKIKYIRESMNGSNANSGCHWCEIQAIDYEGNNIALNKNVTYKGGGYEKGTPSMITDGNTSVDNYIYFRNDPQNTISITIDLESVVDIDLIRVWHYHGSTRQYKNILLETSLDGVVWEKVFDSNEDGEYIEVSEGKTHYLEIGTLPVIDNNSSLSDITYFFRKYVRQNELDKENLKTNLSNKNINILETDKLSSLINKVSEIKTFKKVAGDEKTYFFDSSSYHTYDTSSFATLKEYEIGDNFESVRVSFDLLSSPYGTPKIKYEYVRDNNVLESNQYDATSNKSIIVDLTSVKSGDKIVFLGKAGTSVIDGSSYAAQFKNFKLSYSVEILD